MQHHVRACAGLSLSDLYQTRGKPMLGTYLELIYSPLELKQRSYLYSKRGEF